MPFQAPFGIVYKRLTVKPTPSLYAPDGFTATYIPTSTPTTRILNLSGINAAAYGVAKLDTTLIIKPSGYSATNYGTAQTKNLNQKLTLTGFNQLSVGTPTLINRSQNINVSGVSLFGSGKPTIYNSRQYLVYSGFNSSRYGTASLTGGVKYLTLTGFNSFAAGRPTIANLKTNRTITVGGFTQAAYGSPLITPLSLHAKGASHQVFGSVKVEGTPPPRHLILKGSNYLSFGTPWASRNPRELQAKSFDAFTTGYPKVADRRQKILHADSPKIPGGIFGDIYVANTRRYLVAQGFISSEFSRWTDLFTNRTVSQASGFNSAVFGTATIWNVSPAIAFEGQRYTVFGSTLIAYRIRRINARGIGFAESDRFGNHVFNKTPEFKVSGFNAVRFGSTQIYNKTTYLELNGINSQRFGDVDIWFKNRRIYTEDFNNLRLGSPRVTHFVRETIVDGFSGYAVSRPTVWFRVRYVEPEGINNTFATRHSLGYTRYIQMSGFIATRFGERVIPERSFIYPQGILSTAVSTESVAMLRKRHIMPKGFHDTEQMQHEGFGISKLHNMRQYINQVYTTGSGLVPGEFGQWTTVANRNRHINAIGFVGTQFKYSHIFNNARILSVKSINAPGISQGLSITERVRYLRPDAIENPYMSGWARVHNAAEMIRPKGWQADAHSKSALVVNTRRNFRWIGAIDSQVFGEPMVAFKIRELKFEFRYTIHPVSMPLPTVHLYTRYVETIGHDSSEYGSPDLMIKWNKFTPRWTHREYFGEPNVRNVTPEMKQRGNDTSEFGHAKVWLYLKYLPLDGFNSQNIPKPHIGYRNRSISVSGFNNMRLGTTKVRKTGAPPYSLQTIYLDWLGADDEDRPEKYTQYGIGIPSNQVSTPRIKSNVIFASGFSALQMGTVRTQNNGIVVEPGIQEFAIGEHTLTLKDRRISVSGSANDGASVGKPRLSPHRIYAVMESSTQARANHPSSNLHFVNSGAGAREPGHVVGTPRITHRHRKLNADSIYSPGVGSPRVQLKKRYILPDSIQSYRFGWHDLWDGLPKVIEHYDGENSARYGRPTVTSPYYGPRTYRMTGFNLMSFGTTRIEHFHREIFPRGTAMLAMGASGSGDTPYKPQRLYVGEPKPTIPTGVDTSRFGTPWVSFRVRDITIEGFESMDTSFDISNFKGRLKVELKQKPQIIDKTQHINAEGAESLKIGTPGIRLKTHYIRPDGNSYQYRKGGF